ncbi:UMP-CMP kinase [Scaptodrosophila lebanonensis]|uniref:UMP-CMP kinase n=1 Tax=Drosophila lebanonensis TaxID=7225 RepID=A0A6J2TN70_DROLE|nr:UMP-CMP kinase [Scaptodrosophila lebanonensis]
MWRAFTRVRQKLLEQCANGAATKVWPQLTQTHFQLHHNNCVYLHIKAARNIMSPKPKVVFVLGGPGAGKGTQCSKIVERFQFTHLSAGDLLREERARKGSEFGALIDDYIRNGKIVPVEVTCSLLENAINKSGKSRFLIDGFPRNQDNLDGWNKQMSDKVDMQFVLFFDCGEDVCVARCLTRGQGGSGRTDDNEESMKKRIQTYYNESLPIIKYFQNNGLVKTIDASPDADKVFSEVERVFVSSGFQ